jgi:hypothetical protein
MLVFDPISVVLVTQQDDLGEQRVQFQQSVSIKPKVGAAHSGDAVSKSGRTCSWRSTSSENNSTSAPSSSVAARWNSKRRERSVALQDVTA